MGLKSSSFYSWLGPSGDQSPLRSTPRVTSLEQKTFQSLRKSKEFRSSMSAGRVKDQVLKQKMLLELLSLR